MKYLLKYKLAVVFAGLSLMFAVNIPVAAAPQFAAAPTPPPSTVKCTPNEDLIDGGHSCCPKSAAKDATKCLFAKYVNPIVSLMSALVGIVVTVGIIFGAIQFSSSAGDPQKAANGKNHIRNALLGLLAYLLLYAFLQFIIPGGKLNG
jgi:hypothetical protein